MAKKQHTKLAALERRAARIRKKLAGTADRPRLTVYKSNAHMYAQVVDDTRGATLAFASTLSKEIRDEVKEKSKTEAAALVGKLIAEKAKAANVTRVVFDRNGFPYQGSDPEVENSRPNRVAAVAEAARKAGLEF
jgi:large subunit ribosomal protein L18